MVMIVENNMVFQDIPENEYRVIKTWRGYFLVGKGIVMPITEDDAKKYEN